MLHGAESGIIDRAPSGRYAERHRPISEGEAFKLTQHEDIPALLPATETDGFSEKEIKWEQRRRKATRFYFIDTLRRPTRAEIEEAAAHHMHVMATEGDGEHHAIEPVEEEEHHLAR
jgi:ubiquinol-cytochrome c reductase cytochrome b subunit